ncbi:hypothetical protein [Roseivirga pacifica]|uniref:hypothetical protein n=1 Tax=Roseivirga pacifica TaxID=1267423 RepID=UPI00227C0569|nr:hypothetical protein [Roseivirga pacifica]
MKKVRLIVLSGALLLSAGLISTMAFQTIGDVDCVEKTYTPIIIDGIVFPDCTGAAADCIDCVVTVE